MGRKKLGFIGRNELYTVHGSIGWQEAVEKGGNRYEYQHDWDVLYPFGTTDFAPHVAKLAEQDPDIVLMDAYIFPDMLAIMNEMKKQGLDYETGEIILLGNDVLMLQIFVDVAKQEGISMSSGYVWGWQEHNPAAGRRHPGASRKIRAHLQREVRRHRGRELEPLRSRRLRRRHMVSSTACRPRATTPTTKRSSRRGTASRSTACADR